MHRTAESKTSEEGNILFLFLQCVFKGWNHNSQISSNIFTTPFCLRIDCERASWADAPEGAPFVSLCLVCLTVDLITVIYIGLLSLTAFPSLPLLVTPRGSSRLHHPCWSASKAKITEAQREPRNRYSVIICWVKRQMHGGMGFRDKGKAWLL